MQEEQEQEQNYSLDTLNELRNTMENMSKFNQIEALRILTKYKHVIVNENKYGIHINLSEIPYDIITELITFIKYIATQEQTLNDIEQQKEDYKNTYFQKDNKDTIQ